MLQEVVEKAKLAKAVTPQMAVLPTNMKNKALMAMAEALEGNRDAILAANAKDVSQAQAKDLPKSLIHRLTLNPAKIAAMAEGLRQVAELPDPIGEITRMWRRPNGLQIGKMRVPLGVVGMVYEARPNVTVDAAALCLKSGNAVILRGGSEAINSNITLAHLISEAATGAGVPRGAIQLIETTDRAAVDTLFQLNQYLDVLIPRGGAGLIKNVAANARVPVIVTGVGVCHVYVDAEANLDMAEEIVFNAKTSNPAVCNAMETLLVHAQVAEAFLPAMIKRLADAGVEVRGCAQTRAIVPEVKPATDEDWAAEYLDLILAVRVVGDIDAALEHIRTYGTNHSEAIVTENYTTARRFLHEVDAAAVYVNASTRFTDGFEFGFGAEIGISTQKLHARGPMGLEELTSVKYLIYGDGQVRK